MTATLEDIFPYEGIRPVQSEMIRVVRDAVNVGKHAALEGSTGMGKTIAVLCGLLTSPEASGRRVVYCCRTHRQMDRVIEELRALRPKLAVSGMSLRGRREMCINPLVRRFAVSASDAAYVCGMLRRLDRCGYFKNMLERSKRVAELQEVLSAQPIFAEDLIELCREEEFCPYEIAKEALADAKVIAASYIYLLDPSIKPLFLKNMGADLSDLIVVLDEAHNLPDIAIELASDALSTFSIAAATREAKEFEDELAHRVTKALRETIEGLAEEYIGEEDEGEELLKGQELLETIADMLERERLDIGPLKLFESLRRIGEEHMLHKIRQGRAPRSYLRKLGEFFEAWAATCGESRYMHLISKSVGKRGQPVVKLEIQALDPRTITQPLIDGAYATISMSGTLVPLDAYRDIMGLPADTIMARFPSPFPEENVLALVLRGVTTKETYRKPEMYEKLAERVAEAVASVPANVGVFTASYEVLEGLLDAGLLNKFEKPVFIEEREMSSSKNDRLVRDFKSWAGKGGAVLLGVIGGRNAEGGDYPGDQMNAVVVVGIPYGRPSKRTQTAIEYYESQFPGKGMFYGYYLPAHRRMCQAAGRAHRLLTDKAVVIFMDWRVATAFVKRSLPSWIRDKVEILKDEKGALRKRLRTFFKTVGKI